jgi:hypothetical protein
MGKLSVIGKFVDPKVDGFVVGLIGQPTLNERRDHLDHLLDLAQVSCFRKRIRAFDSQRVEIVEECFLERRREFGQRNTSLPRAPNRLVVHVRDVHHATHLVITQLQMPLQQVFEQIRPEIPDVRVAINRWSAGVHLHSAPGGIERLEFLELARVGVEKTNRHDPPRLFLLHRRHCHRGHSFPAPDRSKPFVRGGLDAYARRLEV